MRENIKRSGLTLTELVVACMIMGVIMSGVAAFGISTKSMHETTSKSTLLAAKMRTAMQSMARDASLAVGDATDIGISTREAGGQRQICFRQDRNRTPQQYSDDIWVCFAHGSSFAIYRVEIPDAVFNSGQYAPTQCAAISCDAYDVITLAGVPDFYTVVYDGMGRLDSVDFFITASHDYTSPADPFDNPEMTMRTRVNPTMITR